jgi:hypothetical protein
MDDRAGPDDHLERELRLDERCVEPERDANLDFHDVLLLSLDDSRKGTRLAPPTSTA